MNSSLRFQRNQRFQYDDFSEYNDFTEIMGMNSWCRGPAWGSHAAVAAIPVVAPFGAVRVVSDAQNLTNLIKQFHGVPPWCEKSEIGRASWFFGKLGRAA
jgi:hypothetical protein